MLVMVTVWLQMAVVVVMYGEGTDAVMLALVRVVGMLMVVMLVAAEDHQCRV